MGKKQKYRVIGTEINKFGDDFEISDEAQKKLVQLQRRPREFSGFVDKDDLNGIQLGSPASVNSDISIPKKEFDFHTHPTSPTIPRDYGDKKVTKQEYVCAVQKEIIHSSMISPADAFMALQVRPLNNVPSLMVSEEIVTRYYLKDPGKYDAFKEYTVKKDLGVVNETAIQATLELAFHKIFQEEIDVTYNKNQGFSNCDDKDISKRLKQRWYEFLVGIGMSIDEKYHE